MMETEETRQWERHVAANNHRLHTITQSLGDVNAFQGGCRELTQWCSDPRAFTAHFEANLLNALQAVVDNATKEGFSSDLASELVALCHHHRRHLSKNASTQIGRWHEQFRRQKRNAKKKQKRDEEGNGNSQITQIQGQHGEHVSFNRPPPTYRQDYNYELIEDEGINGMLYESELNAESEHDSMINVTDDFVL